jgi:hypothetical protein
MRKGNHKFQNTKSQINSKFQKSKRLEFVPFLGTWSLFVIWNLPFGILHTESTSTIFCRYSIPKRLVFFKTSLEKEWQLFPNAQGRQFIDKNFVDVASLHAYLASKLS